MKKNKAVFKSRRRKAAIIIFFDHVWTLMKISRSSPGCQIFPWAKKTITEWGLAHRSLEKSHEVQLHLTAAEFEVRNGYGRTDAQNAGNIPDTDINNSLTDFWTVCVFVPLYLLYLRPAFPVSHRCLSIPVHHCPDLLCKTLMKWLLWLQWIGLQKKKYCLRSLAPLGPLQSCNGPTITRQFMRFH